jgi:hypothetical protein
MNSCTSELSKRAKTWNEICLSIWDYGSGHGLKCFSRINTSK